VDAWDSLGDALAAGAWARATRQVVRIVQRPARLRGVLGVLRWRFRARRMTSRVTRRGGPSVAIAVRDPRLRDSLLGPDGSAEIVDFGAGSLIRGIARLAHRPTGILLVDRRWMAILGWFLRIPVVDARRGESVKRAAHPPETCIRTN
jgi:hypothetical protein